MLKLWVVFPVTPLQLRVGEWWKINQKQEAQLKTEEIRFW
jgi:hypothetical protein